MITRNRYNLQGDTNYQGLSTDIKPYDAPTNSLMLELDTGNIYYCQETGEAEPKEVFVPETAFTAVTTESGKYSYSFGDINIIGEKIQVVFDGVLYTLTENKGHDDKPTYGTFDFEEPLYIMNFIIPFPNPHYLLDVYVQDMDEHTIEIYYDGIPAVWNKVGSVPSHGALLLDETVDEWVYSDTNFYMTDFYDISEIPDKIVVNYDGKYYECTKTADIWQNYYGAPWKEDDTLDYSTYPFRIGDDEEGVLVTFYVPTDEPHTFKIYKGE